MKYRICFSVAGAFGIEMSFNAEKALSYEEAAASINKEAGWECSNCFYILPDDYDDPDIEPKFRYCMNCGAQMFSEDSV